MNIRKLNEAIERALNEFNSEDGEWLISKLKRLKGKYFKTPDKIWDTTFQVNAEKNLAFADLESTFDDFRRDNFTLEQLQEWHHFISEKYYFENKEKGISLDCTPIHDFDDDKTIEDTYDYAMEHSDKEANKYIFATLTIELDKFNGDFEDLTNEIDKVFEIWKNKYDELKSETGKERAKNNANKNKQAEFLRRFKK